MMEYLTNKEKEVLFLVAKGRKNKQIADDLCITEGTTEQHLVKVFRKLCVDSRYEAITRGFELGILKLIPEQTYKVS